MVQEYTLNNPPNPKLIKEVSTRISSPYAFVEKDWYAIQLMKLFSQTAPTNGSLVFGGGTSLSKAHRLIRRFSEDLDFNLVSDTKLNRKKLSTVKKQLSDIITPPFANKEDVIARDGNKALQYNINYPFVESHQSLRSYVQVEVIHKSLHLPTEEKSVQSIISEIAGHAPELTIPCVSPVEIAGNKISALAWRIISPGNNDKTIIRHLHDLAALDSVIANNTKDFIRVAEYSLEQDKSTRAKPPMTSPNKEIMSKLLSELKSNEKYTDNYNTFVENMSYEDDDKRIDFKTAFNKLENIAQLIQ